MLFNIKCALYFSNAKRCVKIFYTNFKKRAIFFRLMFLFICEVESKIVCERK